MGMPVPAGDLDALVLADELGVRGVSYPSLPGAEDWSALGRRFQLRKRSSAPAGA